LHVRCMRHMQSASIGWTMANVQVRGVPEDVHRRLKSQAALAGQSLNEYLLTRMDEIARTPTVPELAERIRERGAYDGPSSARLVREERAAR
jgi:antitoxin FitA